MKITVIGAGYVGLVTAACFAELGNQVLCVKKTEKNLEDLRKGISPIYEPGLNEILQNNLKKDRIKFTTEIGKAVNFSQVIFVCVGTPQNDDGEADLSQIEEVAREIARNIEGYKLIIEKSTVPVHTHQWIKKTIKRYSPDEVDFEVASNPEFLREGSAVEDFMNPDRIVVGVKSDHARSTFKKLYSPLTDKGHELILVSPASAELIKHASNSFLAMKISYINMIAELCEKVGVDIKAVAEGIGSDKRIGKQFLEAGIGYGGSCFPKDVKAFIKIAEDSGIDFKLLRDTMEINSNSLMKFLEKIEDILWIDKDKKIAIWGLAFKPNTDDTCEAPSLEIVEKLHQKGAQLNLYDPQAMDNFKLSFPGDHLICYHDDKYEALRDSDALIILTEWEEFVKADLDLMRRLMKLPIIIDGRNIYEPRNMRGFEYYGIGRNNSDVSEILK